MVKCHDTMANLSLEWIGRAIKESKGFSLTVNAIYPFSNGISSILLSFDFQSDSLA